MELTVNLLRGVPFLRGAGESDLRRLAARVEVLEVPGGRELTTQNVRTEAVFILADGTATSSASGAHVESIGPGGIIGHIALLDHGQHHATTWTDRAATLIVLPRQHFDAFVGDRAVLPGLSRVLAARMRFTEAELAYVHGGRSYRVGR